MVSHPVLRFRFRVSCYDCVIHLRPNFGRRQRAVFHVAGGNERENLDFIPSYSGFDDGQVNFEERCQERYIHDFVQL